MKKAEIENLIINEIRLTTDSNIKISTNSDLVKDLQLSEFDIYILGWRLSIKYGVHANMPDTIENVTIEQFANYFIKLIKN